jgi:putative FmdB family regulatory protein
MPIYEYQCKACGERFERLVRMMGSSEQVRCPKCESAKTERALSVFGVGKGGTTGRSGESAGPGCGRCGGPGPCAMDD